VRKLSAAFLIAGAVVVALAGCGGGGGGGGSTNPPVNPGEVTITGRVMDTRSTPLGVQGVIVTLNGVPQYTAADGSFQFKLSGPPATIIAPTEAYFYVSTRAINQTDYSQYYSVKYGTASYSQQDTPEGARIPIPSNVYQTASGTVSLGTITVTYYDPNNPPPPPY